MAVFEGTFTQTDQMRFAIVIGRFNDLVTSKLLEGCQDCLKRHGVNTDPNGTQVDYAWVPGSFEVPLVARQLALTNRYDAIICLGAIIKGQTRLILIMWQQRSLKELRRRASRQVCLSFLVC